MTTPPARWMMAAPPSDEVDVLKDTNAKLKTCGLMISVP
jgi:hypothetical protein